MVIKMKNEETKFECVLCSQRNPFGFTVHRKFVCTSCLEVIRKLHECDFDGVEETYFNIGANDAVLMM